MTILTGPLFNFSIFSIFLVILILLTTSVILGYLSGKRIHRKNDSKTSDFIPSTILGLLALILGFTFSMAINRYDFRKELSMKEANSIGTLYLRADFFEKTIADDLKGRIKAYLQSRIQLSQAGWHPEEVVAAEAQNQKIQDDLWQKSMTAITNNRNPITALYISNLNEVLDLRGEHLWTLENHVPPMAYLMILIISIVGLFVLGYIRGRTPNESFRELLILAVLFSLIFSLILDLDRPRRGLIREDPTPLLRLNQEL